MDCPVSLRWNTRSCRPRPPHADEYAAATSLILLSESGGGFCSTTASDPTITSPPKMSITNPSGLIIRIKRQKVGSPDTPLPNPIYACWMCDKVFQCSQALGGHMTHHRAKKGKAGDDHHHHIHECSHCHEAFGTGQALGGHMLKHLDRSKLCHN
ncbi:zinc finger protein ZAT10-like [Salvia splendens]|uniref:zinc finger protein ZAT10-like n=1 Tax=Salvia splendens TaxID=180675 RepID=UPI0011025783|nr:zinc finger protein ZAT10-like [Salvia splendens]